VINTDLHLISHRFRVIADSEPVPCTVHHERPQETIARQTDGERRID